MMKRKTIAVLFGGCSTEYPVSLQSAHAVITHLDQTRYEPVLLGITRDGRWLHYDGPMADIPTDTWHRNAAHCTPALISPDRETHGLLLLAAAGPSVIRLDAAFPVLHGKNGEDGTVQGLLELAGIPVVGCGSLGSAVCMDKDVAHRLAASAGLAVPRSALFHVWENPALLPDLTAGLSLPLFVKPARAGSSFGITRVTDRADLPQAVTAALEHDDKVVIEESVPGFEVGCAVLGTETLTVGRVDEIELTQGFFDYTEKYQLLTSKIHMPARITPEDEARVQRAAVTAYRALGCTGCARADFFFTPEGKIVFNEINTIPGFTSHSRYPAMMAGVGLDFSALVNRLVEQAVGV